MDSVEIDRRLIGDGFSTYVIAATGSAHNGELAIAKKLIDAARDGGAHAIMFQAYQGDIYHEGAPNVRKLVDEGRIEDRPGAFAEYMRSRVMNPEWHAELSKYAKGQGVDYVPSVFNDSDLDYLAEQARLGVVRLKGLGVESMDHQDPHFVRKVAAVCQELGIPLVMSLGMREGQSQRTAVEAAREVGCENLVLLHGVFGSPSAPEEQGLSEIRDLAAEFGVPVGFSDHTVGHDSSDVGMAADAVFAGANVYKVQIRLEDYSAKAPAGPHRAVTSDELAERVGRIEYAEGLKEREPDIQARPVTRNYSGDTTEARPSEQPFRILERVVIPHRSIKPGELLTMDNCTTSRGGAGLPARNLKDQRAATAIHASERRTPVQANQVAASENHRPHGGGPGNPHARRFDRSVSRPGARQAPRP